MMPFRFLFILISGLVSPCNACNRTDLDALKLLSFTVSNPLNWSTSTDCCHWEGIACDQDGRVSQLQLPLRGLKGVISPFLRNLTHLSHLNLSHNLLSGTLPDRLFMSLTRLSTLDLSFNSLFGEITSSLPFPSSIQRVDLSSNHLSGTVLFPLLQQASNLVSLNVSNNSFVGPIPLFICSKSNHIKILDFSYNEFSDQIPHGLGGCSEMEVFRAGFNSLRGLLPYDIYNVPALGEIFLPANHLNGPIGDGVVQLSNLTILDLSANELTGELPQNIGKLSKLQHLRLHINNLTGSLPPSLLNCSNLIALNLRVNFLKGDISVLNFSNLKSLEKLDLGYNYLTGNLPESLFMCKSLVAVTLSTNNLMGQIPPSVSKLQSLAFISLSNNSLTNITGAIKSLIGCKNLTTVILSKNFFGETLPDGPIIININGFKNVMVLAFGGCQLTGKFPTWLERLKELQVLDLSLNKLTGSIPGWLGTLHNLFYLELSDNLFSGVLVKELCTLKALTSKQTVQQVKQLSLELPIVIVRSSSSHFEYTKFSSLPPTVGLRNNSLSGHIPAEIGQLKLLHMLDLSLNNFSGSIPDQISALINLERLDLSDNHLSGEIPTSLQDLHFLSWFSIANNNLTGKIPQGTQLQSFPASSYLDNPGLCGFPLPGKCDLGTVDDKEHNTSQEEDGLEIPWFYVIVGLGYATGLLVVCTTLLFHTSWRNAYFQLLTDIKDRFNLIIVVYRARLLSRLRKQNA